MSKVSTLSVQVFTAQRGTASREGMCDRRPQCLQTVPSAAHGLCVSAALTQQLAVLLILSSVCNLQSSTPSLYSPLSCLVVFLTHHRKDCICVSVQIFLSQWSQIVTSLRPFTLYIPFAYLIPHIFSPTSQFYHALPSLPSSPPQSALPLRSSSSHPPSLLTPSSPSTLIHSPHHRAALSPCST